MITKQVNNVILSPFGDSALLLKFSDKISPETHHQIQQVTEAIDRNVFTGLIEYIPAFTSLTIIYNPLKVKNAYGSLLGATLTPFELVGHLVTDILTKLEAEVEDTSRTVEVPVCYGGEFGPDLEYVAKFHQLTIDEVIAIHSEPEYLVHMIGFAPGFPYLGGLSERIATPRLEAPRLIIPAGSVGIAGMQTGVYPIATPGGWQLIGRTPTQFFRPKEHPPSLLKAGDKVKFRPISLAEYHSQLEVNTL